LEIDGETAAIEGAADSGATMTRRFCPRCGTPLFSQASTRLHQTVVRVGALDQPERFPPQATIWAGAAPPWACFDEAIPKVTGQPAPVAAKP
jgi:hypothetical protein